MQFVYTRFLLSSPIYATQLCSHAMKFVARCNILKCFAWSLINFTSERKSGQVISSEFIPRMNNLWTCKSSSFPATSYNWLFEHSKYQINGLVIVKRCFGTLWFFSFHKIKNKLQILRFSRVEIADYAWKTHILEITFQFTAKSTNSDQT